MQPVGCARGMLRTVRVEKRATQASDTRHTVPYNHYVACARKCITGAAFDCVHSKRGLMNRRVSFVNRSLQVAAKKLRAVVELPPEHIQLCKIESERVNAIRNPSFRGLEPILVNRKRPKVATRGDARASGVLRARVGRNKRVEVQKGVHAPPSVLDVAADVRVRPLKLRNVGVRARLHVDPHVLVGRVQENVRTELARVGG